MNGVYIPRWVWLVLLVVPPVGVFVLLWYLRAANAGSDANGADLGASWCGFITFCLFVLWVAMLVFSGPASSVFVWMVLFALATGGFTEWSRRLGAKKRSEWISRWYDTTLAPFARAPRTARDLPKADRLATLLFEATRTTNIDVAALGDEDYVDDYAEITQVQPGKLWFGGVGPVEVSTAASDLAQIGWSVNVVLARVGKSWRIIESGSVYP